VVSVSSLTGTSATLQTQVCSLTGRMEEHRSLEELRVRREKKERRKTVHSFPCLKELCTAPRYTHTHTHTHRCHGLFSDSLFFGINRWKKRGIRGRERMKGGLERGAGSTPHR